MSLNILYSFGEGVRALKRARLATAITISIIVVTLTILDLFLIVGLNIREIIDLKMNLGVFFDTTITHDEIENIRKKISDFNGVEKVVFISKEEALRRFMKDIGEDLGIDPVSILGSNPLPKHFVVVLNTKEIGYGKTEALVKKIRSLKGVEDVVYHNRVFEAVDKYGKDFLIGYAATFIVVLLIVIFLIANTLRLTIISQRRNIQIMKLVGATRSFIRRPYLIQGMIQGVVGGMIASILGFGMVKLFQKVFPYSINIHIIAVFLPIAVGFIFGMLGSQIGIKRFLNR